MKKEIIKTVFGDENKDMAGFAKKKIGITHSNDGRELLPGEE